VRARLLTTLLVMLAAASAFSVAISHAMSSTQLAYLASVGLALVAGVVAYRFTLEPMLRSIDQVRGGLRRFAQKDWTARVEPSPPDMATGIVAELNALGELLRSEQTDLEQREQLLRTIIEAAPMAIVLLDGPGRILYSNETARELFFEGKKLEGHNFIAMLGEAPEPFREAVLGKEDALFAVDAEETETYHLAKRHFELEGEEHLLIMVKHLTRELRRQEVDVWKKLIRVISHELNNSLAPITSLVHSARLITQKQPQPPDPKLARVFDTIEDRAKHLQEFVEGYARFARLPKPRRDKVDLREFVERLGELAPYAKIGPAPCPTGYFDPTQLEQVLINLLKNAQESGSPADTIELSAEAGDAGALTFSVADRGSGMSDEVLRSALLPFYSTKERGTGLGLALSREIVEGHGGRIRIENREDGGIIVRCWLPGPEVLSEPARAKLTLSRL